MNRQILSSVLVFALFTSVAFAAPPQLTEMQKLQKVQNELRQEINSRRKEILDGKRLVSLRHQIEEQRGQVKGKELAVKEWMANRLDKNAEYANLLVQEKEAAKVAADIRQIKIDLKNDPEIVRLEKEAADLRAQAKERADAAAKLFQEKCQATPTLKELEGKQATLGAVWKKLTGFRTAAFADMEYLTMKTGLVELVKELRANEVALRQSTDSLLKDDSLLIKLQANLKEVSNQMVELRKAPPAAPVPAPVIAPAAPATPGKAPAKKR